MVKLCRNPLNILPDSLLSESAYKAVRIQALLGQILRTQRHLSRRDIPAAACPEGSTLCYLLLGKKIPMPDVMGGDLPSVLDGTNPRIEGSLDITGAERESSACMSSAVQSSDTWLKTRMVTNPSHSS